MQYNAIIVASKKILSTCVKTYFLSIWTNVIFMARPFILFIYSAIGRWLFNHSDDGR